ncbi:hypothetical protein K438DRAFT_1557440 [Mycena galopus ATCC 62051]|nr:hypothetical protein K438DRAFT_1557440 [Mycena galopus ATCC 62051]
MTDVHDAAVHTLEEARASASLSYDRLHHHRGNFAQISGGDLHGGGQFHPGALVNGVINAAIFAALIAHPAFQRLAGFATGLFANWAPDLFDFYIDHMSIFYTKYDHLSRPFHNGIWSACTFNLGPRMCTLGHRDFANLVFGWCAITALGNFDFTRGGHLILWDCKLILEFPPGATILIPSASIFHSNIPIAAGERRYSFTQYTAGGLFRWVEHEFQTEEEFLATLTDAQVKEEKNLGLKRAVMGAALFSTLDELKAEA